VSPACVGLVAAAMPLTRIGHVVQPDHGAHAGVASPVPDEAEQRLFWGEMGVVAIAGSERGAWLA
jgi:hypothetical protein